ncbi:hypothetical protein QFC21_007047 [Naganishia friedmannii]|uniref:Uncharacterized protein n=1 Tax=Naganishia friedmannii TaxID=89922 RepID=A0ACC2UY23_9TREE|nr:hypothetical protein QFC21_007047 [Naganishia friedmannii]
MYVARCGRVLIDMIIEARLKFALATIPTSACPVCSSLSTPLIAIDLRGCYSLVLLGHRIDEQGEKGQPERHLLDTNTRLVREDIIKQRWEAQAIITYSIVIPKGERDRGTAESFEGRYDGVYQAIQILWKQRKTVKPENIRRHLKRYGRGSPYQRLLWQWLTDKERKVLEDHDKQGTLADAKRITRQPPFKFVTKSLTPVPSTPAPSIPVHDILEASTEPEDLRLPEPRLATAAEIEHLNEIIAGLQRQVAELNTRASERRERHAIFEMDTPRRETSYAPTNYSSAPHHPKLKASDLPKFSGKDNEDVDQRIEKNLALEAGKAYSNPRNVSVSNYERTDRKDGSTTVSQTRMIRPTYGNPSDTSSSANISSAPRTNCFNCGGNHWRKDCPHPSKPRDDFRNSGSSRPSGSHSVSDSNRTPMNGNKWKSFSKTTNAITTRARAQLKEPRTPAPSPNPEPVPAPLPKPTQPKPLSTFPYIPQDFPTVSGAPIVSTTNELPSEYKEEDSWKDKTPAYATCAFERVGGFSFPICIDSGSSISIIDGNFVNEYLPNCRREKCSSFELKGLGNAIVTESLYTYS